MNSIESGLAQLFKAQAAETPDNVAIVFRDEKISYAQLDQATDSLGAYLRRRGVSTDDPVGIFMDTCPGYIVASIGTLKAGAAFMPMSLDSPEPSLRSVVSESQPKVVITKAGYSSRLDQFTGTHILPVDSNQSWKRFEAETPKVDPTGDSLAFIPYTSGTTGDPKGVMLTGDSVLSSYLARYKFSSYGVGDRVACNIFFPWEFLRPLLKGGTVYVIPDDIVFLPRALTAFISEHQITEMLFTPSLLQGILNSADHQLLRARLSSLRVVWLNGEVVPTSLLRLALDILPDSARVFNTYSISETHDVCTVDLTDLRLDGADVCPVGLPMDGVTVRVLPEENPHLPHTAPVSYSSAVGGCPGAISRGPTWIPRNSSNGTERGITPPETWQRSIPRGMTAIIGRNDSMVKIRGYTVYLGAIEETLRKHCDVTNAAVLAEAVDETNKRARGLRCPVAAGDMEGRCQERYKQRPALHAGALPAALYGAQPFRADGSAPDKSTDGQAGTKSSSGETCSEDRG